MGREKGIRLFEMRNFLTFSEVELKTKVTFTNVFLVFLAYVSVVCP